MAFNKSSNPGKSSGRYSLSEMFHGFVGIEDLLSLTMELALWDESGHVRVPF
ncbi:hypothetical protein [Pseudomonas sp. SM4]|uniref:hypothetical protein n=1 Tax=Pseudomonas sp. SM4 TaxID=3424177 RepID=UPI003F7B118A